MSAKLFVEDMSSCTDDCSHKNKFEEKNSISALLKGTQCQQRRQIDSSVQLNQLNLFRHIQLLSSIIFVFFGSTNALEDNIGASNSIIETVFDYLVTILIPVILVTKKDYTKLNCLKNVLNYFLVFIKYTVVALKIWFLVRTYKTTQDFFFMIYLIVSFTISCIFTCSGVCIMPPCKLTLFVTSSVFVVDVIFLILAVKKNYVDSATFIFILVPIILAFIIGMLLSLHIIKNERKGNKRNLSSDYYKLFVSDFGDLKRPMWIISFCSSLVLCSIVAPSTLWIKVYLTLVLIEYTATDLRDDLNELEKEKEKEQPQQSQQQQP